MWLLLLPFGYQFSAYAGVTEPDKIIAFFLLVLGIISTLHSYPSRINRVVLFVCLAVSFLFAENISLIGSDKVYWSEMWTDAVKISYFIIPLLCINSMDTFRGSCWAVVFIAFVGCLSTFLVSLGMISLPIQLPEEHRLGIEWLPRAKGLFLSTGNLAQYVAFAAAWLIVLPGQKNKIELKLRGLRWAVGLSIVMGLLGTQSRNMFLTLVVSLFVLISLKKFSALSAKTKSDVIIGLFAFLIAMSGIVTYFSSEIIEVVGRTGGTYAESSAMSRIHQYSIALEVFKEHPFLGADPATYAQIGESLNHIHNIWLNILAQGGLVSIIVMFVILTLVVKKVMVAFRNPTTIDDALVICTYLSSMLISTFFYVGADKMFWAILGIATSITCLPSHKDKSRDV